MCHKNLYVYSILSYLNDASLIYDGKLFAMKFTTGAIVPI